MSTIIRKTLIREYDGHILSGTKKLLYFGYILRQNTLFRFKQLVDIAVYDRPGKMLRFTVVYNLLSVKYNQRLNVYTELDENTPLMSLTSLYSGAAWLEREVFDMFGIFYKNHPDLRRLLTDYGFSGFPLRKDFPLTGFLETYYSDEQKRIVYQPVELTQEMRQFVYENT